MQKLFFVRDIYPLAPQPNPFDQKDIAHDESPGTLKNA
jgi:hypothetical protein